MSALSSEVWSLLHTSPWRRAEEAREGGNEGGRERGKEGGKDERRCNYIGRNYTRITWNIIATPAGGGMVFLNELYTISILLVYY